MKLNTLWKRDERYSTLAAVAPGGWCCHCHCTVAKAAQTV